jgi:hypothetical protein
MKKIVLAIAAILTLCGAAAQERQSQMAINLAGYEILLEPDGTRVDSDNSFSNRRHRNTYSGHIGTWELGFNGFRSTGNSYALYPASENGFMDLRMGRSFSFTANLFTFSTSFTRNNVFGLTMGLGLSSNDYVFDNNSAFAKIDRMIRPVDAGRELKKAKLNTFAIHIPLALEVSPSRNFFFSVGAYADLLVGSHFKWKHHKEKLRGPYTNFLQAGVTARVGFRKFYIFGNYGLIDMFKQGQGPALTPFSFGVGFGL